MPANRALSSPLCTGNLGGFFETQIQASFVTLMLTGGFAPCLPCWPIVEVKLQGKVEGFETDDLIVVVQNIKTKEKRKMLGQIKHSVAITKSNANFGEVMQAAWTDFNNAELFSRGKDIIALITGPLSAKDEQNVQWLLNQAKHTKDVQQFLHHIRQAKFSPSYSREKLEVIQYHLKNAKDGTDVLDEELYTFLNHFYILNYDFGNEFGVVLSLLQSHISQFERQNVEQVWARVSEIVQAWNKDAGTITRDKLPEDLIEAFKIKTFVQIPESLQLGVPMQQTDLLEHPDAAYLALAVLIGSWSENSKGDIEAVSQFFKIDYDIWLQKAREILNFPRSPLTFKNGVWRVSNRIELYEMLGTRLLDRDLNDFKNLAVNILKEIDPAFDVTSEERFAASVYGQVLKHSHELRKGIAEGLAILGSKNKACHNCSSNEPISTVILAIHEILAEADWLTWGSLNNLLPILAEAAPDQFLEAVDNALKQSPSPFEILFKQEGKGIFGTNYLTGLLWALEGLAWSEQYLTQVCVILGELVRRDPGGRSANRPINSLATILLPWLPQTLASIDKRKVTVEILSNEYPNVSWKLILQLLPDQQQTSAGSYKPRWRKIVPDDRSQEVTEEEYWQQVCFYAELAVKLANNNVFRLCELIDRFHCLPETAFVQLLGILDSPKIKMLPEEQRLKLWEHLRKLTNKHRRFSGEKWALPGKLIDEIEKVAEKLAPTNPLYRYQLLFIDHDVELYDKRGDWEGQNKDLNNRREAAIVEIFEQVGVEGVIRFSESVVSSRKVGHALGTIEDDIVDRTLLPSYLDSVQTKHKELVIGYILTRFRNKGWKWCDDIDKYRWTPKEIGVFLASLPFSKETWVRAFQWLKENQREYWCRANVQTYQGDGDLGIAVDKLLEYGRPHAAIECLNMMLSNKLAINSEQCVRALLAASSSNEPSYAVDVYNIVELIKFLQSESSVSQDNLAKVEWVYLPLLDQEREIVPKVLNGKLTTSPEFFCQMIQMAYRSQSEEQLTKGEELRHENKAMARNALLLLKQWHTPPGTQQDGTFCAEGFKEWIQKVKSICRESGHLEVALITIGEVMLHSPSDSDGLWIHRAIAAALNDRDADDMRRGYKIAMLNSRGVYVIDPSGKPEKALADQFRIKAEDIENAGFPRFAVTLRQIADHYDREAERIINEFNE